jgi:hypothetical protein
MGRYVASRGLLVDNQRHPAHGGFDLFMGHHSVMEPVRHVL